MPKNLNFKGYATNIRVVIRVSWRTLHFALNQKKVVNQKCIQLPKKAIIKLWVVLKLEYQTDNKILQKVLLMKKKMLSLITYLLEIVKILMKKYRYIREKLMDITAKNKPCSMNVKKDQLCKMPRIH